MRTGWISVRGSARVAFGAVVLGVLAACSPADDMKPLAPSLDTYRLGAGDQLRVLTYNDPQLSNTFTVGDNGTIGFPLVGAVAAAGRTPDELADDLTHILSQRGVLNHPSVSVEVVQYRPVFVLGEVAKPGQYPYVPGMTMESAVAMAGGFTYRAIKGSAGAVRSEGVKGNTPATGKIVPTSRLEPGDVVTVYERYF